MLFKRNIVLLICGMSVLAITRSVSSVLASEIHHSSTETCDEHDENKEAAENKTIFTISGQVRTRGDFVKHQNLGDFGFTPDTHDEQLLSRTRLSLSVEPTEQIKGFIQGQFYDRQNKSDYSKTNLYQGYFEFSERGFPISLKVGRQEFCYGSAFFLGPNDFCEGLVWDGAKVKISPRENLWIDVMGARYVKLNKNTSDSEPALYGFYSSYALLKDTDIDLYFFYHEGGFQFFHSDLPDSEKWFSLGTRIAGEIGERIDYEVEPLYQFGKIDNSERAARDTISAYGGHIEGGYTFKVKHNPRIFAGYAFGSGDSDSSDTKYQEFHGNIYNDNYLVGDTSIIPDLSGITVGDFRASGMNILIAGATCDILPLLNLNLIFNI